MARLFDDASTEYLGINQAVVAVPYAAVCWFNSDVGDTNQTLICLADKDADVNYIEFYLNGGAAVTAKARQTDGASGSAISTNTYNLNTWHHACGIFVSDTDRRALLDGGGKGTNADSATAVNIDKTAIGVLCRSTLTHYFSGMIAEAAIYDLSALPGASASDKADYFEANILPSLAKGFSPANYQLGLKSHWNLIRDLNDSVGGYNLTAFNTPSIVAHPRIITPHAVEDINIAEAPFIDIAGTVSAESGASGVLTVETQLAGSATGVPGTADFLILNAVKFKAVVSAASSTTGYATCIWRLFGNIGAESSLITYTIDLYPDFEATTLFWRPQANIIETLEWKTDILKAHDGTEQRIRIRQSPRQFFRYKILLDTNKLNTWMDSQVHGWLKLKWLVPIWTEFIEHTADINYRDDTITVDTTETDFREGGKAIIWKSRTEYEVVVIDKVRDEQLNLNKNYGILSNFTGKKYIMPVREAYMTMSTNKERYNTEIATATMTFKIHDNTNLTGWIPSANYDGMPVLNTPTFMERTHAEGSNPNNKVLDYGTGTFEVVNHSDFNYTTQAHKFHNDTKAACWDFRKFLYSLNGKQKSILIPTFRSDFVQSGTIVSGQTYVDIEKINLTSNMGLNSMRTYIGFYFPSTGQLIIRKITGITTVGIAFHATLERITFDADLGYSDILSSGDCRIGFVDKCRLESDKVEIDWEWTNKNVCDTKFARVI